MVIIVYILIALGAYLLGSIPTGYLAGRAKGVDIRTVGSKNMGATNVFRTLGKGPGALVLLVDMAKGLLAVLLARWAAQRVLLSPHELAGLTESAAGIVAATGAILGHNYTCWLQFKGGKGIATSGGVVIALVPWAFLITVSTWLLFFLTSRYVSVASIAAAAVLPFATWFTTHDRLLTIVTSAMAALAIFKHKANVQRLRAGTENRFDFRRKAGAK